MSGTPGTLSTLRQALEAEVGDRLLVDEPLFAHTVYRIGGPADLFVTVESQDELCRIVALARECQVPYFLLGSGTNILVSDKGIRGLVIENRTGGSRFEIRKEEALLWAEAGMLLKDLAGESVQRGLAGLEWAVGIPGTVGGAVVGNAGAYGGYVSDVLTRVTILQVNGEIQESRAEELEFGYRTSCFKGANRERRAAMPVILAAQFKLQPESVEVLQERVAEYTRQREARQPSEPSAGSVFKRTAQYPAGFLIEQAGLKGKRIGDAQISPKHANFIVNLGEARASEVKVLMDMARDAVLKQFGIELELEQELVGEWND
ncbi:MAG: UDP-N-acetylmuramate dehydrogenase [Anaerolineales bacterium]|nr:MAG: UDP-N-acetylmuramate dehydrogenase [Anaerolineales bacterium]